MKRLSLARGVRRCATFVSVLSGLILFALTPLACRPAVSAPPREPGAMGARWTPECSSVMPATDLSGLALPAGVDGLLAVTQDDGGLETPYIAGDFCGLDASECPYSHLPLGGRYASLFVRRGDAVERIDLSDAIPLPVAEPEAAALLALASGYRVLCPSRAHGPGFVQRVPGGYEVAGVRRSCEATYGATVRVSDEGEVHVVDERMLEPFDCRQPAD